MDDQQSLWVGLDLGLRKTHLSIIDDTGAPLREEVCETSIAAISERLPSVHEGRINLIAVEAGCGTHVVRRLRAAGHPIAMFEARKASKFLAVRRSKTDASDARGLADMGRLGRQTISQVHLKSVECEQLRAELVMRNRFVKLRVATEGALRARFTQYGRRMKRPRSSRSFREEIEAQLLALKTDEGFDLRDALTPLIDVCESLRECQEKLDDRLERAASKHPVCRRLMEMPGVGPICSISFYTAIEDPNRFERPSDIAAYLGLVPRRYQSGDVSYTRGITKTGSKMTRTHLVTAAMVFIARGPESALKEWASALKERIGTRRAQVALARKLSIILLSMWKDGTHFEPYPRGRPNA